MRLPGGVVVSTVASQQERSRFSSWLGPFCVESVCSPRVCVGSLRLPPTNPKACMLGAPGKEDLGETKQSRGCSSALAGESLTRGKTRTRKPTPNTYALEPWRVTAVQRNYVMDTNETTTTYNIASDIVMLLF